MPSEEEKISRKSVPENVRRIIETVFGCKWSLTILTVIQEGTRRPGAITRMIEGLTPKVMNHCLGKLVSFNILIKQSYPEVPPRVEYHLTDFGTHFMGLFDWIEALSESLEIPEPSE